MKRKILIGVLLLAILLMSLPSISALEYKSVKTSIHEKIASLDVKNIWIKIMLYTIFSGSMALFALIFGKTFGNGT